MILPDWMTVTLSLGERVRVRGKEAFSIGRLRRNSGPIELHGSSGRAGGFLE